MSIVTRFCAWAEGIVRGIAYLGFILFPALILVCVYEVAARYILNAPTIWAFDITFMLHGALFLLTGAYGLQKNVHVRIDVLSSRLPKPVQHAVNIVAYLVCFIPAMWLISDAAIRRTASAYQTSEVELASAWGPLVWPFFLAMAVGAVIMALQSVVETIRHAIGIVVDGKSRVPEPPPADRVV